MNERKAAAKLRVNQISIEKQQRSNGFLLHDAKQMNADSFVNEFLCNKWANKYETVSNSEWVAQKK